MMDGGINFLPESLLERLRGKFLASVVASPIQPQRIIIQVGD